MKEPSHKEEGEAMAQTMAEYLIQQGKEEGKIDTKQEDLLKLLSLRFDAVPDLVANKISSIRNLSRLDTLFLQAATAQTLDEIDWED